MSVRPQDVYAYVALDDIYVGGICAFRKGDPIPESTVEEQGWLKSKQAVLREDWEDRPEDEEPRPMKRGEMPPHLQTSDDPPAKAPARKPAAKGAES